MSSARRLNLPQEPTSFAGLDCRDAAEYRRRISVHESSHAVAALMVGARPKIELTIIRRADGRYGLAGVVTENVPPPPPRLALDYASDRAFVGMAGQVGEAKFVRAAGYVFYPWAAGLAGDNMALDAHARRVAPAYADNYRNVLYYRVSAELDRPWVWNCVLQIARRLESVWPLEQARLGGEGRYVGELSSAVVASIAKSAGLPGRRQ
jgi:hypothetical protein